MINSSFCRRRQSESLAILITADCIVSVIRPAGGGTGRNGGLRCPSASSCGCASAVVIRVSD